MQGCTIRRPVIQPDDIPYVGDNSIELFPFPGPEWGYSRILGLIHMSKAPCLVWRPSVLSCSSHFTTVPSPLVG